MRSGLVKLAIEFILMVRSAVFGASRTMRVQRDQ
jgi:hypothetical protein